MCNVEYKKSIIESTLASAKLYYDDRIKSIELSAAEAATTSAEGEGEGEVTSPAAAAATSTGAGGKSQIYSLFGLKRRISSSSSKKKKDKKGSTSSSTQLQELKIKEDGELGGGEFGVGQVNGNGVNEPVEDDQEETGEDNELELILNNTEMSANEKAALLVAKIDRSVQLLDRLWLELNRQSLSYNNTLINFSNNLQLLHKSFELVQQKLNQNEQLLGKINVVNQIVESDKLADELEKVKNFQLKVSSYQPLVDAMCNHYTNVLQELQHCEISDEHQQQQQQQTAKTPKLANLTAKFDDLNLRWSNLQNQLQENYLHLYSLIESSGADIFIKLADSVQPPWQRAVSANNKIPYYIK